MKPSTFINPYKSLDESELTRLQTYVSKADHDFIFLNLHPGHGSVAVVTNTLFTKLITALKHYGIVDHATQRIEFEQFVEQFVIELPQQPIVSGGTVKGTVTKSGTKRRGDKSAGTGVTNDAGKSTNI